MLLDLKIMFLRLREASMPILPNSGDARPPRTRTSPGPGTLGRAWEAFVPTRRRPEGSADWDAFNSVNQMFVRT